MVLLASDSTLHTPAAAADRLPRSASAVHTAPATSIAASGSNCGGINRNTTSAQQHTANPTRTGTLARIFASALLRPETLE